MNSVGIITIHDIYNYGSILQAYATQKVITELGYRAEIIDYKYPNPFHGRQPSLKNKIFSKTNALLKDLLPEKKYTTYVNRYKSFTKKHYKLSENSYPSVQSLMDNPPEYDIYLAGSDQIWRPKFIKGDPCFFLDFVKERKKIAYASSFGCTSIPHEYKAKYARYLKTFSAIGVRELPGIEIIKELTEKEAQLVLDPTLLLTDQQWTEVMEPSSNNKPYILCYGNTTPDKYMEKLALHIQKQTGLKIIRVNGKFYDYFNDKMEYVLDAGPAEWLGLFSNASIILGQSFHATAFAVNFKKPVVPILRGDENHDSRQKHLLNLLKLQHRAVNVGDEFPKVDANLFNVDYNNPTEILKIERMKSINFLKEALKMQSIKF